MSESVAPNVASNIVASPPTADAPTTGALAGGLAVAMVCSAASVAQNEPAVHAATSLAQKLPPPSWLPPTLATAAVSTCVLWDGGGAGGGAGGDGTGGVAYGAHESARPSSPATCERCERPWRTSQVRGAGGEGGGVGGEGLEAKGGKSGKYGGMAVEQYGWMA